MAYETPAEQETARLSTLRRGPGGDRKGTAPWVDDVLNDARNWIDQQPADVKEEAIRYYNILEGDVLRAQKGGIDSREDFQQWQIEAYDIVAKIEALREAARRRGAVFEDDDMHEPDAGEPAREQRAGGYEEYEAEEEEPEAAYSDEQLKTEPAREPVCVQRTGRQRAGGTSWSPYIDVKKLS